ncbi:MULTISPECIES: N-acetylmuramoyl-L-alanine amidase [unclassified Streptomyces]|uniref:N-acetylmuramoyl-L-alanine amidase n=2 Tax=Streptomyces TaxID=1883 RepID=UPI0029BA31AC|nr:MULTISPECIES: N-acetylmuramoyl-L-alanine amidase [unclassified Streptomyces]MDX3430237.1 N-acetylmuramoyl-L-alanine amidase [Streptomyces sp. ME01-18a]WSS68615.1 N-acetylmuramoyl-L-alanine amidase [Streptomyces sp. NBC_01175]WSS75624.1 N-acetylmuramoyl-L-alanine amidase [Streptomyces sp. NBC_01174]
MRHEDLTPPTSRPGPRRRPVFATAALAGLCLTAAGCAGDGGQSPGSASGPASAASSPSPARSSAPTPSDSPSPSASSSAKPLPRGPLTGRTVVIDPGHNPGNVEHTREINAQVDMGNGRKECDTTGTSTNSGYAEARFTLDVSRRLRTLLEAQGAKVVLTQDGDRPFGPCVDERARIGNKAQADAVVSVHADGSATGNRGFHVILPAAVNGDGADTSKIVTPSRELGVRIAGNFVRVTGSAPSNYIGGDTGLDTRDDLGGLNLSTVPKVFIECGNMRDPKDAALLTSADWRQKAALGIAEGIGSYLKR